MCGLTGILTTSRRYDLRSQVAAMTNAVRHRGPDAGALFLDEEAGIALGHRRLAIVDLSERGAQPMTSACGRYVVVFNGEIYNHLALRRELEASGATVAWRGTSDTETLLAGFVAWGVAPTLKKSVGMFALALWDKAQRKLTLARDRFGEKPLYYGFIGQGAATGLVFGSELKALRAHAGFDNAIDRNALALFMRYSCVPAPHSIYENVFKLEPASIMTIDREDIVARTRRIETYWRYEDVALAGLADPILDEREGLDALERTLTEAVSLQLMADVPVGAFLSGGIDSSTIVALMQAASSRKVKTFTVGFDEAGFDEAPHARAVADHLGVDHTEIRVTAAQTRTVIPDLPHTWDEPFADPSQIATSIVCATARQFVTVALSGDAGDEMFGGYNRYMIGPKLWHALALVPPGLRSGMGATASRLPDRVWAGLAGVPGLGGKLAPFRDRAYKILPAMGSMRTFDDLYRALVAEWMQGAEPVLGARPLACRLDAIDLPGILRDPRQRMMLLDGVTYLPDDILAKVDRAAMAVSLETRVPMLDHRVAEVAWRLPMSMKIRDGRGKWALRQILDRHAPAELFERRKAGFDVPIGQWLRGPLRDWGEDLLGQQRLRAEGFIDPAPVRQAWAEHCSGARDWTFRLWNILMFQSWLESQASRPQQAYVSDDAPMKRTA